MSWEHKTAPELVLGPAADVLRSYDRRGVHAQLPLESKARAQASTVAPQSVTERLDEGFDAENSVQDDRAPLSTTLCKNHPDRLAVVNGKRLCAECAAEWYEVRRR